MGDTAPDPTTLITEDVRDVAARALYDQQNGIGAFDEERRVRRAMGLKWPAASFKSVYRDVDAVLAVIVPDIVKAERGRSAAAALREARESALLQAAKLVLDKKGLLGSINLAEAILALIDQPTETKS